MGLFGFSNCVSKIGLHRLGLYPLRLSGYDVICISGAKSPSPFARAEADSTINKQLHRLRNRLVLGSTVQEVDDSALNATVSRVVWVFPGRPLFWL